ncbi:hypothetical protein [Salinibaculum salinum]|uniref:hypothetical protein n=1 Tax=Salinibaculum salinum TaxID=3131996 RepID=UPI0030EBA542
MDLTGDRRGQSIQIGAIILFGALIILLSTYQAFIVPDQNREVEFNHNQRVQSDMLDLRNTILTTKTTGQDGYVNVELGTEFPARLIALNPTPPSGRLSTTGARPIVIEERGTGSDITTDVCPGEHVNTRFIEYQPNYAVYQNAGTVRYENSIIYNDFGEAVTRLSSQQLVNGDRVQIIPLNRSFNRGGSQTIAVEPKAGLVDTSTREDINVTIPTQLNEQQWERALEGEVAPENITVTEGAAGRNMTARLSGEYTIDCGPVGLGEAPASGERGSGVDEINPASPGDVRLVDESRSGSTMSLFFNNTAGTNNFTEGRINFFEGQGGNNPAEADISKTGEPVSATLQVRGDFETLDPDITLEGDGAVTEVELDFDRNIGQNDWFIITLRLETGENALYFVPGGS